jgi:membrane protein
VENPLPNIPNPWKIFREDLRRVCDKESREVLPKWWMRVARFVLLAYRKFDDERCYMRAAALAFNSLLALVPVLALATAITSAVTKDDSQSVQQFVSKVIVSVLPASTNQENDDVARKIDEIRGNLRENIINFINNLASQIRPDKTGILSAMVFVYLGLLVVMQLEDTFNDLFSIPRSRAWYAQILKFSLPLVLGPGCIIMAFALTHGGYFEEVSTQLQSLGSFFMTIVPLLLAMAGLTFLYKLIPNMAVSWSAAIWGGLVAGTLWQLNHLLSAMYVSHILMKNDLYAKTYGGSLGLLPVFMLAVYFTWLIILYGALVAARVQYHSSPLQESVEDKDAEPVKPNEAKTG